MQQNTFGIFTTCHPCDNLWVCSQKLRLLDHRGSLGFLQYNENCRHQAFFTTEVNGSARQNPVLTEQEAKQRQRHFSCTKNQHVKWHNLTPPTVSPFKWWPKRNFRLEISAFLHILYSSTGEHIFISAEKFSFDHPNPSYTPNCFKK
jgi:hypothetical protein